MKATTFPIEPIEHPKSLYMRLVYWYSRIVFGKVMMPLKIVGARFPAYIGMSMSVQKAEKKLKIDQGLTALLRIYIAQVNVCPFCVDIGLAFAVKQKMGTERFAELSQFETSVHFSKREKMGLRLAHVLNQTIDCPPELFEEARTFFTEREIIDIIWVVATENYYNRMNRPLGIHDDGLHAIALKRKSKTVQSGGYKP